MRSVTRIASILCVLATFIQSEAFSQQDQQAQQQPAEPPPAKTKAAVVPTPLTEKMFVCTFTVTAPPGYSISTIRGARHLSELVRFIIFKGDVTSRVGAIEAVEPDFVPPYAELQLRPTLPPIRKGRARRKERTPEQSYREVPIEQYKEIADDQRKTIEGASVISVLPLRVGGYSPFCMQWVLIPPVSDTPNYVGIRPQMAPYRYWFFADLASPVFATLVVDFAPIPTISSVYPASGPPAGGQKVTIKGDHFKGATGVSIGGAEVKDIVVDPGGTSITGTTTHHPADAAAVDIEVRTPTEKGTSKPLYTYSP